MSRLNDLDIYFYLFNKIRLIVRNFGLEGDSKGFSGKLVCMQVICRTNILTNPGIFMIYLPDLLKLCGDPSSGLVKSQGSLWYPDQSHRPWLR